jgi:phenylacetate-CoA ligase
MKEAQQRETWNPEHLQNWQQSSLLRMLQLSSETVPYYREEWQRRQIAGDVRSPLELQNWPVLVKEKLYLHSKDFLARDSTTRGLCLEHTSGTSGTPLQIWHSRVTARKWYALMEARWRGWYGVSRHDCWGILGGQLVTPIAQKKPPFWIWNAGLNQLYLSAYHISADTCAMYLQALRQSRVTYVLGYASALTSLARFAREQRLTPPQLKVIISNAELLSDHNRALISEVFGCPVRDTYGMCEMVAAASECEHGRLHLWPEAGIVEVLADGGDQPVPYGTVGRLICTGLNNEDMPLIRYELGDRGSLAHPAERCPCGRTMPILESVEGRADDVIVTPDHRRIGRLDPVFKADFPIREAQVIQESLTSLRVKVVPDANYTPATAGQIMEALRERLGEMAIIVECVDQIPRCKNGKFQAVVSGITKATPDPGRVQSHGYESRTSRFKAPLFLKVFHALPPFARSWAASLHGYSLRTSRYSHATARLVEEAMDRDSWSSEKWHKWLEERKLQVLRRAALDVPFYRRYWDERKRRGDKASFEVLANWPILKKESLRMQPEQFVATDCDRRKLHMEQTSGTTGTPLTLWRSRETDQHWYALNETRCRLWNGLTHNNKWGHLGGQPVVPFDQRQPPFWVWNSALKQLYLSCMHIGPHSSAAYLSAIEEYKLDYLLGYSSSIALLAQAALETAEQIPLKVVMTDSEPLLGKQRSVIEKGFGCPVRETYGMAELACAASECSAGSLHVWPEVGLIELLDEKNETVTIGETGRIIATGLINGDMPLIRYDTQDLAQADPDDSPCACGRKLPRLRKLLGRNDDVIIAADGRRLVQIDRIFDPCFDIKEAQIVQEAIGQFRIRIVPGTGWSRSSEEALCGALRNLVGEAQISVEIVSQIERTWAGKYRVIVSKVSATR